MAPSIGFTAGQLLRGYRQRAKLTLQAASEACRPTMSTRTIQRIEGGKDITHLELAILARALGLSGEEIDCVTHAAASEAAAEALRRAEAARAGGGAS